MLCSLGKQTQYRPEYHNPENNCVLHRQENFPRKSLLICDTIDKNLSSKTANRHDPKKKEKLKKTHT